MKSRRQDVRIPAGEIRLEAAFGIAEAGARAPGVIICHPHPQFGGSMDNNVVWALFDTFVERGYAAVAFNFRGVGRSGGRYEEGEGEAGDVSAVLDWLDQRAEVRGLGLGVLGYSFGAWVGLRAALKDPRVRCMGAVAPPLAMYSFAFLKELRVPLFVVSGDRDPFCPAEGKGALGFHLPDRIAWKTLAGADHFFWNREKEAAECLAGEFEKCLAPGQTGARE
jgi:hypothetical protein